MLQDYIVYMEPGRSIIADAGILVCKVLYVKEQAGQRIVITDASMTDLIRPALYQAYHHIVPLKKNSGPTVATQVVGPVCETADILAESMDLPEDVEPGDYLAIMTAGAYGMVMASNYNARPRPAEVIIEEDGQNWHIARKRETWEDLLTGEH
jgi:diaminopimelate decarboxylase